MFQLYPLPMTEIATLDTIVFQLLSKDVREEYLKPGVRWKSQFGTQIIYLGVLGGIPLSAEKDLTSAPLTETEMRNAFDAPRCSSFVSRTFPCLHTILQFLHSKVSVVEVDVRHTLRVTCKKKFGGPAVFYERSAPTRDAVLNEEEFSAKGYYDEQRVTTEVFLPPADKRPKAAYTLFRIQAVDPTKASCGSHKTIQVCRTHKGIEASIEYYKGSVDYVRVEERHVLKLLSCDAEIHVVKVEEYGARVPKKLKPVRVELRNPALSETASPRQHKLAWASFLALSVRLNEYLEIFSMTM
ncbi:hypothetical protein LBRM_26_0010 [Leishmania braziliensis MHOM/BR/75/M2904]|uniref:Uncharacterized protein n=2 Tax=Leishmania braziliensis TaxID=5660 RepID=A4HEK7_LEIBR|nr:hypothetical protein LBRM_26_0010 [Leishmania braziliensis MHOM/BR/75/M2904]CAJ2474460.1 unnamed protein product [Leishmania braziliensis]CAJ2474986.1 unnamed protein product [Leishmania braziliensis]CAM39263.1 hypothetical protein LBRM_26_0010 [Leishmania braziliensis MHOM/BR/75/M2904]SYZ66668.1 hypothetical_protein [Leishmania braziliensis MHOM/BR/75/M2904]